MSTENEENAQTTLPAEWKQMIDEAIRYLQTCENYLTEESYRKFLIVENVFRASENNQETFLKHLLDKGYCKLFEKIWNALSGYLTQDKWGTVGFETLNVMLLTFMNLTNVSAEMGGELIRLTSTTLLFEGLQYLTEFLNQPDDFLHGIIGNILGILQNTIRLNSTERFTYRNANAVPILKKYLESPNMEVKTDSLLVLAYTVDESESNILAREGVLRFLVDLFKSAVESEHHQVDVESGSYSAMELLQGLNRLAVNDDNKREIQKQDGLTDIVRMLKSDFSEDEQQEAVKALWNMAFVESIRESALVQDTIESLENLLKSGSKSLQKACNYALWEIKGGQQAATESSELKHTRDDQVMISYQWGCQRRALEIKEKLLQCGLKVWMDVENMRGDILSSMADAVKNSTVILICMTEKYKDSQSCRSEATYAYKLQKKMIPVLMEPNYTPDGWLGLLLGMDLYYTLHSDDDFEANMSKLLTAIGESTSSCKDIVDGPTKAVTQEVYGAAPPNSLHVCDWSTDDVQIWLKKNKLPELCETLDFCDGSQLEVLQDLYRHNPKEFKEIMMSDYQMSAKMWLMFAGAIKKLFRK